MNIDMVHGLFEMKSQVGGREDYVVLNDTSKCRQRKRILSKALKFKKKKKVFK